MIKLKTLIIFALLVGVAFFFCDRQVLAESNSKKKIIGISDCQCPLKNYNCVVCKGKGVKRVIVYEGEKMCPNCGGFGYKLVLTRNSSKKQYIYHVPSSCGSGTSIIIFEFCETCKGKGKLKSS